MLLKERLAGLGALFFKYRSYTPVLFALVMFVFLASTSFHYRSGFDSAAYELVCLGVSLLGLAIRVIAVGYSRSGTSGRNKRGQVAESLNADGIYSIVRNPLYFGNFFVVLGITLLFPHYEIIAINILLFVFFYIPIIYKEEEFLLEKFKDAYVEYCRRTPAIIPNFRLWRRPELKFNLSRVLRRENGTFTGIIVGFVAIEVIAEYFVAHKVHLDWGWIGFLGVGLVFWAASRLFKRRLRALDTAP